jgi:arylsulfatase A-like enzyme
MKNVILLTIDCLRRDALGCYGSMDGVSSFIDSVAEDSIRFTRAQTIAPYTQASFPGILTSTFYYDHAREEKQTESLSLKRTLVSEVLSRAGITTAAFHSNPYLGQYFGWNRGWKRFYDSMEEEVSPVSPFTKGDAINRRVDRWLYSHIRGGEYPPFFLWTHYMDVHEPYVTTQKYVDMIDPSPTETQCGRVILPFMVSPYVLVLESQDAWYASPFCRHVPGYRVCAAERGMFRMGLLWLVSTPPPSASDLGPRAHRRRSGSRCRSGSWTD